MNDFSVTVKWIFFACLLFIPHILVAQFQFNPRCEKAYQHIMSYRLAEAQSILEEEKSSDPQNLVPLYLEDYIDLMHLLAYEDDSLFEELKTNREERLSRINQAADSSPYKLFALGEIYLHWSIIKAKYGKLVGAGLDFNRSYNHLEKCLKQHPDFLPPQKSLLAMKAVFGTLPQSYRFFAKLLGFKGDLEREMATYEELLHKMKSSRSVDRYYYESNLIYAYMLLYLMNEPDSAWKQIEEPTADHQSNMISAFARASIAMRGKKNEEVLKLSPGNCKGLCIPHLYYLIGKAHLHKLDPKARWYFGRYITNFDGGSYIKDAYLNIGWSYLMDGDTSKYRECMYLVEKMGESIRDEDKNALQEKSRYNLQNLPLLKARLLFDGGYYSAAFQQISEFESEKPRELIEKFYRLGRVHQEQKAYRKALDNFAEVFTFAEIAENRYFVPASYYYAGIIYEEMGNRRKAAEMFEHCLTFKDYPYKNSFDQKANAGLKRIENN